MNFDEAIAAHSQWKMKLSAYLSHPDGSIDAATAGQDNKCPLGNWIAGEGTKYSALPEYAKLKSEHTRFHKAVSDVIRKAASGQKVGEETALGAHLRLVGNVANDARLSAGAKQGPLRPLEDLDALQVRRIDIEVAAGQLA